MQRIAHRFTKESAWIRCLSQLSFQTDKFQFVEFRNITEYSKIDAALDSIGPSISAAHIGAAFAQTQKLLPRPPDLFLNTLSQKALSHSHVLDFRSIAIIFQSCAALAYFNTDLLNKLVDVLMDQIPLMDFKAIAEMIHIIGMLRRSQIAHNRPFEIPQQESLIRTMLSRLTPNFCYGIVDIRCVKLLLLGLANLKYGDQEIARPLLKVLFNELQFTLLEPKDLTAMLYALSRIEVRNLEVVKQLADEAVRYDHLSRFTESELSSIIYCVCKLGLHGRAVLSKLAKEASRETRLKRYTDQSLANILYGLSLADISEEMLLPFLEAFLENKRLMTCRHRDLKTILHVFAKKPVNHPQLLSAIAEEVTCAGRIDYWSKTDLVTLLYGFAQCAFDGKTVLEPLAARLDALEVIKTLSPIELADVIYAFGRLGLQSMHVYPQLRNSKLLKSFSMVSLIRVLTGLSYTLDPIYPVDVSCAKEALVSKRLQLYSPAELTQIANAFFRMKFRSPEFIDPLERVVLEQDRFKKLSRPPLAELACALAKLRDDKSDGLVELFSHLSTKASVRTLPVKTICNLLKTSKEFNIEIQGGSMDMINELERMDRRHTVLKEYLDVISALSYASYDGSLWKPLFSKLSDALQKGDLALETIVELITCFGENGDHMWHVLTSAGIVEQISDRLELSSTEKLSNREIFCVTCALEYLKLPMQDFVESLSAEMMKRIQEEDFKDPDLIQAIASLLACCFQLNISNELVSKTWDHLKRLHWTVQMNSSFDTAPYLSHTLIVNLLCLEASQNRLTTENFNLCLELIESSRRRNGLPSKQDAAKLYQCYLSLRKFAYRPTLHYQYRLLRYAMGAHTVIQNVERMEPETSRIHEAINLLQGTADDSGILRDVNMRVDIVDERNKTALIFKKPVRELDFTGVNETGEMMLKKSILEQHGYKVITISSDVFDKMTSEAKREWIETHFPGFINETKETSNNLPKFEESISLSLDLESDVEEMEQKPRMEMDSNASILG